jgi:predicted transcriptional regulator
MGRKKVGDTELRVVTTKVRNDLYKEIKKIAIDEDRDLYLLIEDAIRAYIKKSRHEGEK